jgi:hypothetical protein
MRKSMVQFIQENRKEIDTAILGVMYRYDGNGGRGTIPENARRFNDVERKQWILNDAGLYDWARAEGVRI